MNYIYTPPPVHRPIPKIARALFYAAAVVVGMCLIACALLFFQVIHAALEPGGLVGARLPL